MNDDMKEKLATGCRILALLKVAHDNRGHVSFRISEKEEMLLPRHLHEVEKGLQDVQANDIVLTDFEGKVIDGSIGKPMGEFYAYSEIYRRRPDVKSIAHFHPMYANILTAAGLPIKPVSKEGQRYLQGISILKKFPLYVGDSRMATSIARALGRKNIVIHQHHGAFVAGKSIEDAVVTSIALERGAQMQWLMHAVGTPQFFPNTILKNPSLMDSPHSRYHDSELSRTFNSFAREAKELLLQRIPQANTQYETLS